MAADWNKLLGILEELQGLYAAVGDNYRSNAYAAAAAKVRLWLANGQKEPRPKFAGKSIMEKIAEWESGGGSSGELITTLADMRKTAAAVKTFSGIAGVGPSAAAGLARKYKSLADLRQAMSKGEAKLTHIQRLGLRYYDDLNKRIPRAAAKLVGEEITAAIARKFPGTKMEIAGSYRRGLADVGDIDIICSPQPRLINGGSNSRPRTPSVVATIAAEIHSLLTTHTNYIATVNAGPARMTLMWRSPAQTVQVDVIVVPPTEYAAALVYFTGSKQFNVCLRGRAKRMGMRLNQMGLFRHNGSVIPAATEQDIFAALGLEYIQPADRNDGAAIDAAAGKK